ncbi:MAG TPA: transcription termination/antitermination NusG family protein [Anaerolineales bacterium]|nr:transcription termination/antitermination NusG family protein [Anaerolineales bacterium]
MLRWYVIHSKPQKERWLYNQMTALQIEAYYPCLCVDSKNPHLQRAKPYFPGYLFVNVDLELTGISVLQWIPGSSGLVAFGGEPACVPDGLLQKIRHRVEELNSAKEETWSRLKSGDQVSIHSGPFAGYEAIFCARLRDTERVQVLLKVLQEQTIRIDLSVKQLTITNHSSIPLLKQ